MGAAVLYGRGLMALAPCARLGVQLGKLREQQLVKARTGPFALENCCARRHGRLVRGNVVRGNLFLPFPPTFSRGARLQANKASATGFQ